MTPASLSTTLADLAPVLKNHLWQSTLFLAIAALLTLALRRNHAHTRYWLWLAASIKFLLPFSFLITLGSHLAAHRPAPPTQTAVYYAMEEVSQPFDATSITLPIATPTTPTKPPTPLLPLALASIWLAGFVTVLTLWFVYWRRITVILRAATPIHEGRELDLLRHLESALPDPCSLIPVPCIQLLASTSTLGPGIYGILRPRLIWPAAISQRLDDAHLASILAHEICHVRRRDNLTAALHMLVEAIFWFHPLVWWLGTRLETERERACDESVLALTPQPRIYAESILKICEFYVESPLPCVSGVTGADLKKRLADILARHTTHKLSFAKKLLLAAAAVIVITIPILSGQAKAMQRLSTLINAAPRQILPSSLASFIAPSGTDGTALKDAAADQTESPSQAQSTQPIPVDSQSQRLVAQETADFLITQLVDAKQTLDDSNARLTAFLHQNGDKLASFNSDIKPLVTLDHALVENAQSIQQLEQNRSVLEALLAQQTQGASTAASPNVKVVRDRLNGINLTIAAKQKEQQQLEQQKDSYQPQPQSLSSADEEFRALTRDLEISLHNYNSILAKLNQVDLAINTAAQTAAPISTPFHGIRMMSIQQPEAPAFLTSTTHGVDDWLIGGRIDSRSNKPVTFFRIGWAYVLPSGLEFHQGETIVPNNSLLPHGTFGFSEQHVAPRMESLDMLFFVEQVMLDDGTDWHADHKKIEADYRSHASNASAAQLDPTTPKPLTFDVVSIRVNNSGQAGNAMRNTPDGFIFTNCTLQSLIGGVYGNRPDLISGLPSWAQTTRYDIQAKVAPEDIEAYTKLQRKHGDSMYQALLEDRFKLVAHIETKDEPIYELVVAKDGPKLHEAKPGDTYENGLKGPDGKPAGGPAGSFGRGEFTVQQTSIGMILNQLQGASGRSVVDKTGLKGKYDITLHWEPASRSAGPDDAPPDTSGPSIFAALQEQLGLKLQPAKGPVKSLVIDHIEKPTEN